MRLDDLLRFSVLRLTRLMPAIHNRLCRRWNSNTRNYWDRQYTAGGAGQHWASQIRLHFYDLAAAAIPKEPATILDVGSGLGWGPAHIAKVFPDWCVEGLDFSAEACAKAVVKTHCVDVLTDDLPGPYDFVLAVETLEHLNAPMPVLDKMYRAARKAVILTVPYKGRVSPLHPSRFDEHTFDKYADVRLELCQRLDESSGEVKTDMLALIMKPRISEARSTTQTRDRRPRLVRFLRRDKTGNTSALALDRCDPYLFFARDILPSHPVMVEVGSFRALHAKALYDSFHARVIVYEASAENYANLLTEVSELPIEARHAAVTGTDGEIDFFEFTERSSHSIFPRHRGERRTLKRRTKVRSISIEQVLGENELDRIDVLFCNCEGSELGIINEVLSKPRLCDRLSQLCVSFHGGRVYSRSKTRKLVERLSRDYLVIKDPCKWGCYLFVPKANLP